MALSTFVCSAQGVLSTIFATGDSTAVYYFQENDFELAETVDTLGHFQRFNPLLMGDIDQHFLGNIGSPHYPLLYQSRIRKGFDLGYHSYDAYLIKREDVRFYNNRKPYTEAIYTAGSQDEATIFARYAQNIAPRVNVHLRYNRINHSGGFDRQKALHSNYTFSTWYHSPNEAYRLLVSYAGNTIKQQNNGGIADDSLLTIQFYQNRPNLIPVTLTTAQSEYTHNEYSISQYWNPFIQEKVSRISYDTLPAPDSIRTDGDSLQIVQRRRAPRAMSDDPRMPDHTFLRHTMTIRQQKLKFFDQSLASDSSFYGNLQAHEYALRHFVQVNTWENNFGFKLFVGNEVDGKKPFMIEPGLTHAIHWIYQEPEKFVANDLLLTGKLQTQYKDWIRVEANGHFALAYNAGDYSLQGKMIGDLKKLGTIEAGISQQSYSPSQIQRQFFLSEQKIWDNDFLKTQETSIYGRYENTELLAEVEARFFNINKMVYHRATNDSTRNYDIYEISQLDKNVSIAQLIAGKNLKFSHFHFENKLGLQFVSSDSLNLPRAWWRSSIFYENILFKGNLQTRVGFDLRYNSNFYTNHYSPADGQFYWQDQVQSKFYPIVDFYINFKVQRFRSFLKFENLSQLALRRYYFVAPGHPGRNWLFKFGVSWSFID